MNINKKDSFGHVFSYSKADDDNNDKIILWNGWLMKEGKPYVQLEHFCEALIIVKVQALILESV